MLLPLAPSSTSRPGPPRRMSSPAPPRSVSLPAPPTSQSSPSPPSSSRLMSPASTSLASSASLPAFDSLAGRVPAVEQSVFEREGVRVRVARRRALQHPPARRSPVYSRADGGYGGGVQGADCHRRRLS